MVEHAGAHRAAELSPSHKIVATFIFDIPPGVSELKVEFKRDMREPGSTGVFSCSWVEPPAVGVRVTNSALDGRSPRGASSTLTGISSRKSVR